MMEKKRLPEQMASHHYKTYTAYNNQEAERRPGSARGEHVERQAKGERGVNRLHRVVTVPEENPSEAWHTFAERQEQRRRARTLPKKRSQPALRTFAQTGTRASQGRIQAIRRPLPYNSSPIPTRSGQRSARRGFIWKLLGVFTCIVVLVLAANFMLTNNAFRIEQVSVIGTHNDALIRAIQHMGMQEQNIFLLNVPLLTAQIEAFPQIASATLSRQLPNQLIVNVLERVPLLLWQTPRGTYSVDGQGIVIAPAASDDGHIGVVMQVNVSGKQQNTQLLHPGSHLDQAAIKFANDIFERLPKVTGITAFKLQYDGTIYASTVELPGGSMSRGSFVIASSDGWKAYLGGPYDANPLNNRLLELQAILAMTKQQQLNVATIDLRYGLRPFFTVKQ